MKRKMAGKKREKAAPSTASTARSASKANKEFNTMSPVVKKKKSELLETIAADAQCVKEELKAQVHEDPVGMRQHRHHHCAQSSR